MSTRCEIEFAELDICLGRRDTKLVNNLKDLLSGDRYIMTGSHPLASNRSPPDSFFPIKTEGYEFFCHRLCIFEGDNVSCIVLNKVRHASSLIETDNGQPAIGCFQANERKRIFSRGQEKQVPRRKIASSILSFSKKTHTIFQTQSPNFRFEFFNFPSVDSDPKKISVF